jgi:hypothetical protein
LFCLFFEEIAVGLLFFCALSLLSIALLSKEPQGPPCQNP